MRVASKLLCSLMVSAAVACSGRELYSADLIGIAVIPEWEVGQPRTRYLLRRRETGGSTVFRWQGRTQLDRRSADAGEIARLARIGRALPPESCDRTYHLPLADDGLTVEGAPTTVRMYFSVKNADCVVEYQPGAKAPGVFMELWEAARKLVFFETTPYRTQPLPVALAVPLIEGERKQITAGEVQRCAAANAGWLAALCARRLSVVTLTTSQAADLAAFITNAGQGIFYASDAQGYLYRIESWIETSN